MATAATPLPDVGPRAASAPGRRALQKAGNEAAILAAARRTFAELGFGAATVRDIVRRTDLGVGTFYNYFPDKESVFRRLVEQSAIAVRARVRAARARATTFEELVHGGFLAWFEAIAEDPAMLALMRRTTGTVRLLLAEPAFAAGIDELLDDVRAATARGVLGRVDADYLTGAIFGIAFELAVRMVERQPVAPEAAAAFATALVARGVGGLPLADAPRPPRRTKRRIPHGARGHRGLGHRRGARDS